MSAPITTAKIKGQFFFGISLGILLHIEQFRVRKSKFFHRLVQFLLTVLRKLTALAYACERLCVLPVEEIHILLFYLGDFVDADGKEECVTRGVECGDLLLQRDRLAVFL